MQHSLGVAILICILIVFNAIDFFRSVARNRDIEYRVREYLKHRVFACVEASVGSLLPSVHLQDVTWRECDKYVSLL